MDKATEEQSDMWTLPRVKQLTSDWARTYPDQIRGPCANTTSMLLPHSYCKTW